jgi:hypothetical protein
MSLYPLSAALQKWDCDQFRDKLEECTEFPCDHAPCKDVDKLEDGEDLLRDSEFFWNLWDAFRSLSTPSKLNKLKSQTSPERWLEFEARFDRCRRIEAKRDQINRDHAEHEARLRVEAQKLLDRLLHDLSSTGGILSN